MNIIKKALLNPFALIGQGFLAGAVIFFATAPASADARQEAPQASAAPAGNIAAAQ